jgi:hypothetical protein
LDPANQLSTDAFAGHLAHNTNLSIKAILALDGYATLAGKTGHSLEASKYHASARAMAKRWTELAADGDPLSPRLRQARHVESKIQFGLGQNS